MLFEIKHFVYIAVTAHVVMIMQFVWTLCPVKAKKREPMG